LEKIEADLRIAQQLDALRSPVIEPEPRGRAMN
jgi:hypothetical protein